MMESNFIFLGKEWPEIFESAHQAEESALSAPRTSAFYSRYSLERTINYIFDIDLTLSRPYQDTLSAMMHEQTFIDNLAPGMFNNLIFIRKLGNKAVHDSKNITPNESLTALRHLYTFHNWFAVTYGKKHSAVKSFNESFIPKTGASAQSLKELQRLQEEFAEHDRKLKAETDKVRRTEEELAKLKDEIKRLKAANNKRAAEAAEKTGYSEADTRALLIDLMLNEAGWDISKPDVTEYEVTGMPNDKNTGYADYVLWGDDGLPLAVVEAKRTSASPKAGQHQAKLYADALEKMHGQRPVIFYSNGYESYIWDDMSYPPREVQGFYKKDELQRLITRRGSRMDITKEPVNKIIVERYYQETAIRHVTEIYSRNARGALLVMATGTGKTRVAIAAVELLMKANWVKRVLFLADRTALVKQAKNRFSEFLPNVSLCNLLEEKEDAQTRIVFSTYPTIMNAIDDTKNDSTKIFGVGHFDLIIIDEAHRSVYQKYGAIFAYFDSILLGLTATPKTDIDHNTYHLFSLEDHMPTYAYEIDKAVADGFLVPPKAIFVPLKFQRDGIKYSELSEEEQAEYENEFRDEETGYIPGEIGSGALNSWLFNTDTVDKVLVYLMTNGIKVQGGDKLGKTIIFAKSHKHAEFIEERFNKVFPQYKGSFLQIIDNAVKYAQNRIDTFSDKEKEPTIAISVDMLDTGIDIPEIVNLVLFKIVRSKSKFWQMIGRGTRLCKNLFAPDEDKTQFVIFDFCENFEFFGENPDGLDGKAPESLSKAIFTRRLNISYKLQSADYQQDNDCRNLYTSLLDALHSETSGIDRDSFTARPHLRYLDLFKPRERWNNITLTDIGDITEHIAHLPATHEEDELAKRFDLLILNMQLATIEYSRPQNKLIHQVVSIASSLEKKGNIPAVMNHIELIKTIQTDEFINSINIISLEKVRAALRDLIKFIDREDRKDAYTDFEDAMGEATEVGEVIAGSSNLSGYRKRFEKYIHDNENHIAISKLKLNKPLTSLDISELEKMLFSENAPGNREEFEKIYGSDKPLGYFIRNIVGLERNAAKEAFSWFMEKAVLNSQQISFVDRIIDYLTQNGVIEPDKLFEPPFTDIHSVGVVGVFPSKEVGVLFSIIKSINMNAGMTG